MNAWNRFKTTLRKAAPISCYMMGENESLVRNVSAILLIFQPSGRLGIFDEERQIQLWPPPILHDYLRLQHGNRHPHWIVWMCFLSFDSFTCCISSMMSTEKFSGLESEFLIGDNNSLDEEQVGMTGKTSDTKHENINIFFKFLIILLYY